jgi:hypothetical protein
MSRVSNLMQAFYPVPRNRIYLPVKLFTGFAAAGEQTDQPQTCQGHGGRLGHSAKIAFQTTGPHPLFQPVSVNSEKSLLSEFTNMPPPSLSEEDPTDSQANTAVEPMFAAWLVESQV